MKIVQVKKMKKNYKVLFDSGDELIASEDFLIMAHLFKDQEFTEEEFHALQAQSGYDRGVQLAMNYISYQLRTKKEVDQYLKEQEFSSEDRPKILTRLIELRLIDDRFYAESFVRTQLSLGDKGPKQLKQKMKQKGLDDETIEYGLTFYTKDDELDLAQAVALKLNKRIHHKSYRERLQKIRMGLMQKGYDTSIIEQVMQQISLELDEEEETVALEKTGEQLLRRHARLPLVKREQKVKQSLYTKGFSLEAIQIFLEKERENEE